MTLPESPIRSFGCRLNSYESSVIQDHLVAAGLKDVVVVNSCAVTAEAERQVRQAIRKAHRDHPNARIVVTGCAAQIHPDSFAAMPEVSAVVGNQEKLLAETWHALDEGNRVKVGDIMTVRETAHHLLDGVTERARAFIEIQQGCDHRCTFCIIPYGRGNNRSLPAGVIVDRIKRLVDRGLKEIVLTGVDITAYGQDLPGQPTLGQLVQRILRLVPDLPRLRLSSIDVAEVDADLFNAIATEPRLMPHLHLSLQSGSDMILKRMKRRHTRQQAIDFCVEARRIRPDIVLGADLIAGFPTETDDMHHETLEMVRQCHLSLLHVFPYSARSGTPAARMPQLPKPIRQERAAALRTLGQQQLESTLNQKIGAQTHVLIEKTSDRGGVGHDEHFLSIIVDADMPLEPGSVIPALITGHEGIQATGRIVS